VIPVGPLAAVLTEYCPTTVPEGDILPIKLAAFSVIGNSVTVGRQVGKLTVRLALAASPVGNITSATSAVMPATRVAETGLL